MHPINPQVNALVRSVGADRSCPSAASGRSGLLSRLRLGLFPGLIGSLLVGCNQIKPLNPEFTMQVQPTGPAGTYTVSGQTNLPKSPPITITVQAIRKLRPLANTRSTNREPLYAVVAKEQVETQDGQWQTTLKLQQPNSAGTPLESWQLNQNQVPLEVEPEAQVSFVAATAPLDRSIRFVDLTEPGAQSNDSAVLQTTNGNNYLKTEKTIALAPPPLNRGLARSADRPIVKLPAAPAPSGATSKQTNAPLKSQEFVR
jgi:hypothetical protein